MHPDCPNKCPFIAAKQAECQAAEQQKKAYYEYGFSDELDKGVAMIAAEVLEPGHNEGDQFVSATRVVAAIRREIAGKLDNIDYDIQDCTDEAASYMAGCTDGPSLVREEAPDGSATTDYRCNSLAAEDDSLH